MGSLFPKPITGIRLTYIEEFGITKEAGTIPVATQGSIQPGTGREFEAFNILRQDKGLIHIYCDDQLQVTEAGGALKGDILFYIGQRWEIIRDLTHNQGIINHYHYIAQNLGAI